MTLTSTCSIKVYLIDITNLTYCYCAERPVGSCNKRSQQCRFDVEPLLVQIDTATAMYKTTCHFTARIVRTVSLVLVHVLSCSHSVAGFVYYCNCCYMAVHKHLSTSNKHQVRLLFLYEYFVWIYSSLIEVADYRTSFCSSFFVCL